jgi:hypothetical protein
MKYWEMIADKLSASGWSWGCVSAVDCQGRTIWIVDAHRGDGKRFIVRADGKLTAFLELERVTRQSSGESLQLPVVRGEKSRAHFLDEYQKVLERSLKFQPLTFPPIDCVKSCLPSGLNFTLSSGSVSIRRPTTLPVSASHTRTIPWSIVTKRFLSGLIAAAASAEALIACCHACCEEAG